MNRFLCVFLYYLFSLICLRNNYTYEFNKYNYNNKNFNLIIDKINLDVNVYDYDSKFNDVNKGIYLATNTSLDNFDNSIILASHSGSSSISYFKNLHKLDLNDEIILKNDEYKYIFSINKIYKINKNGKFSYSNERETVYLITCDKQNTKKQLIYRAKLQKTIKKSKFY